MMEKKLGGHYKLKVRWHYSVGDRYLLSTCHVYFNKQMKGSWQKRGDGVGRWEGCLGCRIEPRHLVRSIGGSLPEFDTNLTVLITNFKGNVQVTEKCGKNDQKLVNKPHKYTTYHT